MTSLHSDDYPMAHNSLLARHPIAVAGAIAALGLLLLTPLVAADDEVRKGRDLATRMCAMCHMNPGQGEKLGPEGVPGFAAIANRPDQTAEGIVRWLQSAPPMMPDHKLSRDEAYALAEFILSLRRKR